MIFFKNFNINFKISKLCRKVDIITMDTLYNKFLSDIVDGSKRILK